MVCLTISFGLLWFLGSHVKSHVVHIFHKILLTHFLQCHFTFDFRISNDIKTKCIYVISCCKHKCNCSVQKPKRTIQFDAVDEEWTMFNNGNGIGTYVKRNTKSTKAAFPFPCKRSNVHFGTFAVGKLLVCHNTTCQFPFVIHVLKNDWFRVIYTIYTEESHLRTLNDHITLNALSWTGVQSISFSFFCSCSF